LLSSMPLHNGAANLEIGWHFLRGGRNEDAARHGLLGAESALAFGAPAEAQQILDALVSLPMEASSGLRVRLLLAKALLDRSQADRAAPLLDELSKSDSLDLRGRAEVTRLVASAEFLKATSPTGIRSAAAQAALEAARATQDIELLLNALLEYARTCKIMGNEDGIRLARDEADRIADSGASSGSVYLIRAYCDFYMNNIHSAQTAMERALELSTGNLAQLSFIYTGLGTSSTLMCEFSKGAEHLQRALEIAQRIGDDSRSSRVLSNLTLIENARGHYKSAIECGQRSIALAERNPNQPELVTAYMNLGDAYLLTGQTEAATTSLERAQEWVASHNQWQMTLVLLLETASRAMTTGNVALTLSILKEVEKFTCGRVFTVQGGLVSKLEVLRAMHTQGPEAASQIAEKWKEYYRVRTPFFYLDALGAAAWAEKRCRGGYSTKTVEELKYFERWGAFGKRDLLKAQGFLD
jgi:tetratricopeptide (TPR) repeat protein